LLDVMSDFAPSFTPPGHISAVSMRACVRLDVTAKRWPSAFPLFAGNHGRSSVIRRSVMKKLIAALALVALIAVPTLATPASAQVSPASSSFGSNGY
jgi:hypothetical protein